MDILEFTLGGQRYSIAPNEVKKNLKRLEPEPIRHHYVTINGREFPIKQAFAEGVVKGLDRLDFTTAFARRVFQPLDLQLEDAKGNEGDGRYRGFF
jgi:hypothetical protein